MARYFIGRSSPVVRRALGAGCASAPRIGFRPRAAHPLRAAHARAWPGRSAGVLHRNQKQCLQHRAATIRHPGDTPGGMSHDRSFRPCPFPPPHLQPEAGVRRRHDLAARRPSRRRRDCQPKGQPQPEPHSGPRADHRRALRSADHLQRLNPPWSRRAPSGSAWDRVAAGVAPPACSGRGPSPPMPSHLTSSLPMR